MDKLSNKELQVLDQVGRNSSISQRELSRATGISLGLINVILKKFLNTGYLQVSQLNKRKLQYGLTPEGFLAIARKTYRYATNTIRNYHQIHSQVAALLKELSSMGHDYFFIHGEGELRQLIEAVAPSVFDGSSASLGEEHREVEGVIILNVSAEPISEDVKGKEIRLLDRLEI